MRGVGRPAPTPAPLTGFLNPSAVCADSNFAALFRAATAPGFSLQSLPLVEIVNPLEPTCSRQLSTAAPTNLARGLVTAGFPDSRAFGAVAMFPQRLWTHFPRTEIRFPFVLGHRLPSVFPAASPASKL